LDIRDISKTELLAADEVFITGTSKGLVPVVRVDGGVIAEGRPGARTRRLMSELKRYTDKRLNSDSKAAEPPQAL
jgi:branched-chain amino acid aminotransferase